MKNFILFHLIISFLYGDDIDDILKDFEIATPLVQERKKTDLHKNEIDFSGKLIEQVNYSFLQDSEPHDKLSSLRTSLFLDYRYKVNDDIKIKINLNSYYDVIYKLKGRNKYSPEEVSKSESEIELFDTYIEGSLAQNLDFRFGRQVVVWGDSDSIRITDILNPLDNRRPGMVDIEELRLPVNMLKFDYFTNYFHIAPIVILEQRFSKNPPFGSIFNLSNLQNLESKEYKDPTYGLSIDLTKFDIDMKFYYAKIYYDNGYIEDFITPVELHDKIDMFGTSLSIVKKNWVIRSEIAYLKGLKDTAIPGKEINKLDILLGTDYYGMTDATISYDIAKRKYLDYNKLSLIEKNNLNEVNYQHVFRISYTLLNSTLSTNYLLSLEGLKANEGGYQRIWAKYNISDTLATNFGIVDYIGGADKFENIKNNDSFFMDFSLSF